MKSLWYAHLKGEEQDNFKNYLRNSKEILDRLDKICYNMIIESDKRNIDYDSPAWAYRQAHSNGYKEALDKVREFLKLSIDY